MNIQIHNKKFLVCMIGIKAKKRNIFILLFKNIKMARILNITWRVHSLVRRTVPHRRLTLGRAPACAPRGSRHCPQTENMGVLSKYKSQRNQLEIYKSSSYYKVAIVNFQGTSRRQTSQPQAASQY